MPTWLAALFACTSPHADLPDTVPLDCTPTDRVPATGIVGLSDPHADEDLVVDIVGDSGAPWVRAEIPWSIVQPEVDGPFDFGAYDLMVEAYRDRDVEVLLILTYVPPAYGREWEAIDAGFRAYATEVVTRYAAMGVHHFEVFNEPNLTGYGWLTDDDDAWTHLPDYTRLLGIANEVVRAHDPEGFVVIGGIASEQHRGLSLAETMEVLYGYGAQDCFDVMGFHPYGYQNRFAEARRAVQEVMDAGDAGDKPVWFSEYGWTDQESMDLDVNDTVDTNPMMAAFDQKDVADAFFWFSAKDYSSRASAP
ncbi:MAG: hypothetical protein KC621_31175, partial [Myxococcales bacterium]|nr:hypothetical protein [Myxococcales bacterium]